MVPDQGISKLNVRIDFKIPTYEGVMFYTIERLAP